MNNKPGPYRDDDSEIDIGIGRSSGITGYLKRTFAAFEKPTYRFYFIAMAGHWSSMSMQAVARSQLVYVITGSGAILGLNSLANAIPMLLLSLPGGFIADRIQKKTVVQLSQLVAGLVTLWVTVMLLTGYLGPEHPDSWWIIIASSALQGMVMGIQMPSRQALIPELVSEKRLMNAISLNNLGMNVFRLLSPALAGFLIDAAGFYVVYAVMTAMYVVAVICMAFIPSDTSPKRARSSGSLSDITDAWSYVRKERGIFIVLVFSVFATVLGMPFVQLLPMFTSGVFNTGATGQGVLISLSGAGAILGSLVIANLTNRRRGIFLLVFTLMMSITLTFFAFSQWWYLSLFLIMFVGAGNTGQIALGNSLIQYYADPGYRGRVMSFYMMGFGFGSLGAFFAGILAEAIGVQWAVGGMAIVLLVICLFMLTVSPRLRQLD